MKRIVVVAAFAAALLSPTAFAQSADILVTKDGPAQATAGSDVTYTVTVTNLGDDPADGVTLDDPIPAGMTFASLIEPAGFTCTDPGVGNGGTVNCSGGTLTAGDSAVFTFVFTIPPGTPDGTSFTNVATGDSETPDPNDENDSGIASTSTPPPPQSDMSITKTGQSSAGPGTDVTYTITVSNAGPDDAAKAAWTDTLPGTMTFVSLSGSGMTCTTPAVGAGGTIDCALDPFPAGQTLVFTLTGHIPADTPSGTTFFNTVTVVGGNDTNDENDAATTGLTVSSVDVFVVKQGPPTANAGTDISYAISVGNTASSDTASSVELHDVLPPNTTFVSFIHDSGPTPDTCGMPAPCTTGSIDCLFVVFPAGAQSQFTLTVTVGDTTSVTNTAFVTTESFDIDQNNNSDSAITAVTPIVDVGVSKNGPGTITAGTDITYTIDVTNAGPSTATNVTLSDPLPPNTTFGSLMQSGPLFNCTTPPPNGTGTINCSRTTFAPNALTTFTVVLHVSPSATGSIDNTATVANSETDSNGGNQQSTTSATVSSSADVSVSKSGPTNVNAGNTVTYTIVVTNAGPSDAADVSLTDTVPAPATFVSLDQTGPTFTCTTPAMGGTGLIDCDRSVLAPGATTTFTLVVQVPSSAPAGSLVNTAMVTTTTSDPDSEDHQSVVTTTIANSADVSVTKTGPGSVNAGNTVTYTIVVTNAGPSDAADVSLTDTLPAPTTFVSLDQTGPAFTCTTPAVGDTGAIDCDRSTLAPGETTTFTLVVQVPSSAAAGPLVNTAVLTTATGDPDTDDHQSAVTTNVATSADVRVTKSGPATAIAGTDIVYTVSVFNDGPSDAATVSLQDTIPPETVFVSGTQTAGPTFVCAGAFTCDTATLVTGASATFEITVHVPLGTSGTITNEAQVSAATPDPTTANNEVSASTDVSMQPTDISVTKTAAGLFTVSGIVTYTIDVTNNGPGAASSVVVTDPLPAGTTLIAATTTQGTCSGTTTVVCTIGILPAGGSATINLEVQLPDMPGTVVNTATATLAEPETNPDNNAGTTANAVLPPIPTLSPIALALLALAIAAATVRMLR